MKNKLILALAIVAVAGSFAFISNKKVSPSKSEVRQSSTTEGFALRD